MKSSTDKAQIIKEYRFAFFSYNSEFPTIHVYDDHVEVSIPSLDYHDTLCPFDYDELEEMANNLWESFSNKMIQNLQNMNSIERKYELLHQLASVDISAIVRNHSQ
jgi:hypothetical protein